MSSNIPVRMISEQPPKGYFYVDKGHGLIKQHVCPQLFCQNIAEYCIHMPLCTVHTNQSMNIYGVQGMCECHEVADYCTVNRLAKPQTEVTCATIYCNSRATKMIRILVCDYHAKHEFMQHWTRQDSYSVFFPNKF